MAFVRKKSKPIKFSLGGEDDPILYILQIKAQKAAKLFAEYPEALKQVDALTSNGEDKKEEKKGFADVAKWITKEITTFLDAITDTVIEATVKWENVTDEDGKDIVFDKKILREIVDTDFKYYFLMFQALLEATGLGGKAEEAVAAKN